MSILVERSNFKFFFILFLTSFGYHWTLKSFYGGHPDLVCPYSVAVSRILMAVVDDV